MNKLIILLVIGVVVAPPPPPPPAMRPPPLQPIPPPTPVLPGRTSTPPPLPKDNIIRQTNEINPDGSYQWSYESDNGIFAEEKGQPLNAPDAPIGVIGNFRYRSLEGSPFSLTYVADENGFQPVGHHLPTAPPIPPLIARSLAWIAAHPEPNIS